MSEKLLKKTTSAQGEVLLYQTGDGATRIEVRMEGETVWLSLKPLVELFQRDKSVISRHIRNIFEERELKKGSPPLLRRTTGCMTSCGTGTCPLTCWGPFSPWLTRRTKRIEGINNGNEALYQLRTKQGKTDMHCGKGASSLPRLLRKDTVGCL